MTEGNNAGTRPAGTDLTIGIWLPTAIPPHETMRVADVAEAAQWAEAAGFDAAWVGDHMFHAQQYLESLTVLAYVAARTQRIKLGPAVYVLPLRPTAIAAKQISTLASLAEGRLVMGIGVGGEWPKEWVAAGVPTTQRGARLDEALPLLRRLLGGEQVEFTGRFNAFPGVQITPRPPAVPIYLAGRAAPALRRAALHGDGWWGFFLTLNGFKREVATIRALREEAGLADRPFELAMQLCFRIDRSNDGAGLRAAELLNAGFPPGTALTPVEKLQNFIVAGTPGRVAERLQEFVDAGARTFCLTHLDQGAAGREQLEILAAEVLPRLRRNAAVQA